MPIGSASTIAIKGSSMRAVQRLENSMNGYHKPNTNPANRTRIPDVIGRWCQKSAPDAGQLVCKSAVVPSESQAKNCGTFKANARCRTVRERADRPAGTGGDSESRFLPRSGAEMELLRARCAI